MGSVGSACADISLGSECRGNSSGGNKGAYDQNRMDVGWVKQHVPTKSRGRDRGRQGLLEGAWGWFEGCQTPLSFSLCFLAFIHHKVMMPALRQELQSPLVLPQ